jgi:hypothetical protein
MMASLNAKASGRNCTKCCVHQPAQPRSECLQDIPLVFNYSAGTLVGLQLSTQPDKASWVARLHTSNNRCNLVLVNAVELPTPFLVLLQGYVLVLLDCCGSGIRRAVRSHLPTLC